MTEPQTASPALTVMTYNIRVGVETSLADLVEAIRAVGVPDVLALQEVGLRWRMGECVDQAAVIGQALGLDYTAFAGALLDAPTGGRFGVALASRWPLDGVHTTNLPRIDDEQRVILRARVLAPRPVVVLNTHLSVKGPERLQQAQQLALAVAAEADPVIALGDWNDRPDSETVACARGDQGAPGDHSALIDCFDAVGDGDPLTFSVAAPQARIDYIAVSPALVPLAAGVARAARASDHFPVWARLGWSR